jgi:hypothetical protein
LLPASAAPATASFAAPARTLPTTFLALLRIPADDFDLLDFLPAFFLVVALDFFERERRVEGPVVVDFFLVVFLVAMVLLLSIYLYKLRRRRASGSLATPLKGLPSSFTFLN